MHMSETWCKLKVKLQNYPSIIAFLNYYVVVLHFRYGIRYQNANAFTELRARNRFSEDYLTALADRYSVVSLQWVPIKARNEPWKGEANTTERCENVRYYSAVFWWSPFGRRVLDRVSWLFTGSFSPLHSMATRCLYTEEKKKGKAALSIELLINNGLNRPNILSGVMMAGGIVRHIAYRDLIYGITAPLFVFVSHPNCFVRIQLSSTPE